MSSFSIGPRSSWNTASQPPAASQANPYSGWSDFGVGLSMAGIMLGAVGSFYSAKTQQNQLKSQALSAEFERSMANLNARAAEQDAQAALDAGNREIGLSGLRYAQEKAAQRAQIGGRGIQAGVGSAAETQASTELAKQIDALTLRSSAVRAANAARTGAVDMRNRSLLAGASAANLRAGARSIQPWGAPTATLLGGAGQVAGQWASNRRWDAYFAGRS